MTVKQIKEKLFLGLVVLVALIPIIGFISLFVKAETNWNAYDEKYRAEILAGNIILE